MSIPCRHESEMYLVRYINDEPVIIHVDCRCALLKLKRQHDLILDKALLDRLRDQP